MCNDEKTPYHTNGISYCHAITKLTCLDYGLSSTIGCFLLVFMIYQTSSSIRFCLSVFIPHGFSSIQAYLSVKIGKYGIFTILLIIITLLEFFCNGYQSRRLKGNKWYHILLRNNICPTSVLLVNTIVQTHTLYDIMDVNRQTCIFHKSLLLEALSKVWIVVNR